MASTVTRSSLAAVTIAASLAVSTSAGAQSKPFPTSGHYAQGFIPAAATAAAAQGSYTSWKSHYLKQDCGGGYYRVDNGVGDASTFSEGQGYGMVLTAYFGDKTEFDGLWSFAKKNFNPKKMMGWHVTCSGFTTSDGGDSSASDGDEDIALGLIVAAVQWGGTYAADAMSFLATMKTVDFTTCSASGRNVVTAGTWQGNVACTTAGGGSNTSYWMPGYYRVFDAFTGDSFWGKTADDVVTLYGLAANPSTGIIVNEVDQNGAPVSGQSYDYNSCRIPWRAALDYTWYGTADVKTRMTNLTGWVNGVGIKNIVDGYRADGTATGQYTGLNAFVGGFAVGAMTDSQALADSFGTYFVSIADDNGGYYGASLRTLYLLTLSGNQWNPAEFLVDGGAPSGSSSGGTSSGGSSGAGGQDGGRTTASGAGGDGGTNAGGAGMTSSSGGTSSGVSGDAGESNGARGESSGCGCRVHAGRSTLADALALALLGLLLGLRRKQRR